MLLPGLPLQHWNVRALEAIGIKLGRFIMVDEHSLSESDKRMAKVLLEVNIHYGLLEALDIEWRGHYLRQRLEYFGIAFRYIVCRRTRNLRRDCQGSMEEDVSKDSLLWKASDPTSLGVNFFGLGSLSCDRGS